MTPAQTAVIVAVVSLLGVIAAAWIGAWAGRRAALRNADANADIAKAAVQDAFTRAYEAADQHWARYNEGMQRWNESLAKDVASNSRRLATAEMHAAASELRATKSETLYRLAIIYLHTLASWFAEMMPGENLPPPPPELEGDLDGSHFRQ